MNKQELQRLLFYTPDANFVLSDAIDSGATDPADAIQQFDLAMMQKSEQERLEVYKKAVAFPKLTLAEFVILLEHILIYTNTSLPGLLEEFLGSREFTNKVTTLGLHAQEFNTITDCLMERAHKSGDTDQLAVIATRIKSLARALNQPTHLIVEV